MCHFFLFLGFVTLWGRVAMAIWWHIEVVSLGLVEKTFCFILFSLWALGLWVAMVLGGVAMDLVAHRSGYSGTR